MLQLSLICRCLRGVLFAACRADSVRLHRQLQADVAAAVYAGHHSRTSAAAASARCWVAAAAAHTAAGRVACSDSAGSVLRYTPDKTLDKH